MKGRQREILLEKAKEYGVTHLFIIYREMKGTGKMKYTDFLHLYRGNEDAIDEEIGDFLINYGSDHFKSADVIECLVQFIEQMEECHIPYTSIDPKEAAERICDRYEYDKKRMMTSDWSIMLESYKENLVFKTWG